MEFVIASNNAHKIQEIKNIFIPWTNDIYSLQDKNIDIDVLEDGNTFEENAIKKAVAIQKMLPNCYVLADDSGLEVDALQGAPGVHSARFAGEGHDDDANNEKLLQLLEDVPADERAAQFVCAVALYAPNMQPIVSRGVCRGRIASELIGTQGFGYDPLFIVENTGKTFGELSEQEKATISHRGKALKMLCEEMIQRNIFA